MLKPLAERIKDHLESLLDHCDRIDRITSRAKDMDSFLKKAAKCDGGRKKYDDPIHQIQDQVGARVVTFFLSDVTQVIAAEIERYFHPIEAQDIVPDSDSEFGYFYGKHYVLLAYQLMFYARPTRVYTLGSSSCR